MNSQAFPYPPHTAEPRRGEGHSDDDSFLLTFIPAFLVHGFFFMVIAIIRNVLSEKETGIKVRDVTGFNIMSKGVSYRGMKLIEN